MPLGPRGLDLPAIIAEAAAAAAASPSVAPSAPAARMMSPLKLIHLRFICRVATNAKIPRIWIEVCWAPTKASALAVLFQYLWVGREVFRRDFFGSADMLHVCKSLFMFVHWDRFVNPRHDPNFPAGGMSFWTTRQGGGNIGEKNLHHRGYDYGAGRRQRQACGSHD